MLIGGSLVVAFGFLPQNYGSWRGERTYKLSFCSKKKECSFIGAANVTWWGHSNTTRWDKSNFELCALRGSDDVKSYQVSLAPEH